MPKFSLMDDAFMSAFFDGNTEDVQFVLRIIMDKPRLTVRSVESQKSFSNLHGRSLRLDVVAEDENETLYNIEIQRASEGAGRKRARYHSSMLDANVLRPGEDFESLPESCVIFITEKDVLKDGLPLYNIERTVTDSGKPFKDGSRIIYVNGSKQDDTALGKLMHDFKCADPDRMINSTLAAHVKAFKTSEGGTAKMCEFSEKMYNMGRTEGRSEGVLSVGVNMMENGFTVDAAAKCTNASVEELKRAYKEKTGKTYS